MLCGVEHSEFRRQNPDPVVEPCAFIELVLFENARTRNPPSRPTKTNNDAQHTSTEQTEVLKAPEIPDKNGSPP